MQRAGLSAVLVLLTVTAYGSVWKNGFVDYDDAPYITTNPHVCAGLTWQGFSWALRNAIPGLCRDEDHPHCPYWMPITWLSLQVDAQLFSTRTSDGTVVLDPAGFHAQSLFWHCAATLLLFAVCCRLTGARWRSFLVAGLFAVHPMHVESVAWVIERKDVLSTFFGILAIWGYSRFLEGRRWRWYGIMTAALVLSLSCKPTLISFPFLLLLLDWWPLNRINWSTLAERGRVKRLVLEKLPVFIVAAGFALLTVASRERQGSMVSLDFLPLHVRFLNALSAYVWYLVHTFYPVDLAVLYPHPFGNWSVWQVLAGTILLTGISALGWLAARTRPWLLIGWFWFIGTLLPVIGLAQGGAQGWADRFSYWPHIGLFIALVWGGTDILARLRCSSRFRIALATVVLVVLTSLTWFQVGYWRDTQTLWERALAVTGQNDVAHQHLCTEYRFQGWTGQAEYHGMLAHHIRMRRLQSLGHGRPGPAATQKAAASTFQPYQPPSDVARIQ
jgi:protein O-mannosyl-transferase